MCYTDIKIYFTPNFILVYIYLRTLSFDLHINDKILWLGCYVEFTLLPKNQFTDLLSKTHYNSASNTGINH